MHPRPPDNQNWSLIRLHAQLNELHFNFHTIDTFAIISFRNYLSNNQQENFNFKIKGKKAEHFWLAHKTVYNILIKWNKNANVNYRSADQMSER